MNVKFLFIILTVSSLSLSAQTQSWQWVKAGGSNNDAQPNDQPAECKIAGCDAKGNVYGVGMINGSNVVFDTFSCPGIYPSQVPGDVWTNPDILLFSCDCSGKMRWAKHIGDQLNLSGTNYGVATDPSGNTYIARTFYYGYWGGCNSLTVYLGDSIINSVPPSICQSYLCLIKYDSLGKLVWFKNLENDTVQHTYTQTYAYGLRIGSSGNLWVECSLDSNYAISTNLHTTLKGLYNVEVDPVSGDILGGYYICNKIFQDASSYPDTYYDLDENENYYQSGQLNGDFGAGGDTLILATQRIAPNTNITYTLPYIYSLDKNGNFRYIITDKAYSISGFGPCKYDLPTQRLVATWGLDTIAVYGRDTFRYDESKLYGNSGVTPGLFAIDPTGNILWAKFVTQANKYLYGIFSEAPTAFYTDHFQNNGLIICNTTDTLFNKDTATLDPNNFTKIISKIDQNGNLIATHVANMGDIGQGLNIANYGAKDWRGNVYLGGTFSNFIATPADSVVNTDQMSGNFFIAKLGISDCSCPLPGAQFTQVVHGDTVYFYGSSANHSDSILWRLGDGGISRSDTLWHVYTNHDSTYSVTAIAYSGCGVDSITKLVTVNSLGIKAIEPNRTSLYPNPATGPIYLDVSGAATIGLVYANGSSVWQTPVQVNQQGTYVFDMSKYSCAMYYFIVQYTNGKTDVMQVVKD